MATVINYTTVAECCPTCSSKGRKVAPLTVRAVVKPELAAQVRDETYRFCASPACDVVYFSEKHPEQRFHRADLRVRVGQKESEPPIQSRSATASTGPPTTSNASCASPAARPSPTVSNRKSSRATASVKR